MMPQYSKNPIISDSDSHSIEDTKLTINDNEIPLSKRWKKLTEERKWKIPSIAENFEPREINYTDNCSGVQQESGLSECSCPTSIFHFFFDKELIELIVNESNNYRRKQGFSSCYYNVTSNDIYCFIAIIMYMGIVCLPTLSMYWSTNPMYNIQFVRRIMSRTKFLRIMRFLHFSDINENNNTVTSRIYKIQPIINILSQQFQRAYRPGQNIAVDKSLLLWKDKLSFKQYDSNKRVTFGLNSFILAESKTGYVYNLKLYSGQLLREQKSTLLGIPGSIVLDLSKNLLHQGRTLFLDSWFTSPALYESLYKNGTHACGTVQLRRKGMPHDQEIKNIKKLKKGEIIVRYNKFMTFCGWKDKQLVSTLSTLHTPHLVTCDKIDYITGQCIKKPNCILEYNINMGGVNRLNKILHGYESFQKTLKWYKKYFLYLLEITICNSLVIWNCLHTNSKTFREIKEDIISGLLEKYYKSSENLCNKGKKFYDNPLRFNSRCFPKRIPPTKKKIHPTKRCGLCKKNGLRKETTYCCQNCDVSLCVTPCFELYHVQEK